MEQIENTIDKVIARVGKRIVLAIPLAAGKPNQFVNALYQRAKNDKSIQLKIITALSLNKPEGKSLLEKNFLGEFSERVFGNYPNLDYQSDRENNVEYSNIEIVEFYFRAGNMMNNRSAQENYISSNYTHAARDILDAGVNVIAQIVSPSPNGKDISLSCNPDLTLDILHALKDQTDVAFVAQINRDLPFMYGDAVASKSKFNFVIDDPKLDFKVFSSPKMSVSNADHMIGLYASTLVKDGGELQIGIGSLADALAYSLLLKQNEQENYLNVLSTFSILEKFKPIIDKKGHLGEYQQGLFAATEMMVDAFMHLVEGGIIKRKVYDNIVLQRLVNEGLIKEDIDKNSLYLMIERRAVQPKLSQDDFQLLQYYGFLKSTIKYDQGYIVFENGDKVEANFNSDECSEKIIQHGLGNKLINGAFIHAGFFLGEQKFYKWLRDLPEDRLNKIHMKSVSKINQLYGHEKLDRLHRKNARFINTCLMMTLSGGAASDGLENGKVISGVGGQYNFVSMAQALPDGHSILQLRSTRTSKGKTVSNIVFNYGHITIPRHLRDMVITEYGIADIRGKSDSEVAARLIEIADSRFQQKLIEQAKSAGKLREDYQLPKDFTNNYPHILDEKLNQLKANGLYPNFPFGCDFTDDELIIGAALKRLKAKTASKPKLIKLILSSLWLTENANNKKYLQRMQLSQPKNFKEKLYQKLLIKELSASTT